MLTYGKQVGVIVYGGGMNARYVAADYTGRGMVVVWCSGYARIHEAV